MVGLLQQNKASPNFALRLSDLKNIRTFKMKICIENECEEIYNLDKFRHLLKSADLLAVRRTSQINAPRKI